MVQRGRRNNRRRTNGVRRRGRGRLGLSSKSMFTGVERGISANPKASQQNPWNSVILQRIFTIADSTAFTLTDGYIRDALLEQLGIPTSIASVSVRPISIELYDLAGRPFQFKLVPYFNTGSDVDGNIISSVSFPGRNTWSRAKLTWPRAQSSVVLSIANAEANVLVKGVVGVPFGISNVVSTSMMVRINVLWKTPTNDNPTLFDVKALPVSLCKALETKPNPSLMAELDSAVDKMSI